MIFTFIILGFYLRTGFTTIIITNPRDPFKWGLGWLIYICLIPLIFGLTLAPAAMISEAKAENYEIVEYDKDIASITLNNNEYKVVFKDHSTITISADETTVTEHSSFDPCVIKFVEVKNTEWFYGVGKVKTGKYRYEIYIKPGTKI